MGWRGATPSYTLHPTFYLPFCSATLCPCIQMRWVMACWKALFMFFLFMTTSACIGFHVALQKPWTATPISAFIAHAFACSQGISGPLQMSSVSVMVHDTMVSTWHPHVSAFIAFTCRSPHSLDGCRQPWALGYPAGGCGRGGSVSHAMFGYSYHFLGWSCTKVFNNMTW